MNRSKLFMTLPLVLIVAMGCVGNHNEQNTVDIPRRVAYPRIEIYDTIYNAISGLPINMEVNAATVVSRPATEKADVIWLDIDYPLYKATLHCTLMATDAEKTPLIVDNRTQRMSLNLGDNAATQLTVPSRSGNYDSVILSTTGQTLTPVQFLAVGSEWIVSGALQWHSAMPTSADSISPIVEAVNNDVIHTLLEL